MDELRIAAGTSGAYNRLRMAKDKTIYSVSHVNSLIKAVLEEGLPSRMAVAGELTDWVVARSGHAYFSLKDENALLPCVMWKSSFAKVKFEVENGQAVVVRGHIDVYPPQGKYQFYAESMAPEGIGALQLAFEQMVKKLRSEGLFDDEHKKELPAYPRRIGIVTSESGAAVHDIAESIFNRWPCAKLFLYPVPVQGEGAAEKIASALRDINRRNKQLKLDVLIVGRGGGSMEDLWAFNEEVLARAIFDSEIPVISAVGHEIDTTVADMAADKRASTPTKAGVVAVPDIAEVLDGLASIEGRLRGDIAAKLKLAGQNLKTLLADAVFRDPFMLIRTAEQQLDDLEGAMSEAVKDMLASAQRRVAGGYEQIIRIEPHRLIGRMKVELNNLRNRAGVAVGRAVNQRRLELTEGRSELSGLRKAIMSGRTLSLTAAENRLAGLNPRAVLNRGYSITSSKRTGKVIRSSQDVEIGDFVVTELADDERIDSKVINKRQKNDEVGKQGMMWQ
ncbi:MAG: exodeoxyribonuclease VII large subunit [Sedimentisphaerales bacterium]|nr:exodeoxyribonuclease VII large subunit [Sedimentisphaerales bacterium]